MQVIRHTIRIQQISKDKVLHHARIATSTVHVTIAMPSVIHIDRYDFGFWASIVIIISTVYSICMLACTWVHVLENIIGVAAGIATTGPL